MMCWYCHWGWSNPVADIYEKYLPLAGEPAMHYGPAHIVWDDENFKRSLVQACLDDWDEWVQKYRDDENGYSLPELAYVKASLVDLLALDDAVLSPAPDDGWDNPAAHPPTVPCRHTSR
jgi:hypothetical protein